MEIIRNSFLQLLFVVTVFFSIGYNLYSENIPYTLNIAYCTDCDFEDTIIVSDQDSLEVDEINHDKDAAFIAEFKLENSRSINFVLDFKIPIINWQPPKIILV